MPLNLANHETRAKAAVKGFWTGRGAARDKQTASGKESPHFPVFPEFRGASYLERYHLLCKKLMQEQFYNAATVLASPRTAMKTGEFSTHDDLTSLTQFVASFAGHIAAVAAAR